MTINKLPEAGKRYRLKNKQSEDVFRCARIFGSEQQAVAWTIDFWKLFEELPEENPRIQENKYMTREESDAWNKFYGFPQSCNQPIKLRSDYE